MTQAHKHDDSVDEDNANESTPITTWKLFKLGGIVIGIGTAVVSVAAAITSNADHVTELQHNVGDIREHQKQTDGRMDEMERANQQTIQKLERAIVILERIDKRTGNP